MKRYNGFMPVRSARRELLPPGGYVVMIAKAEDVTYSWGTVLLLSFDIAEGEHKGHFAADYKQNTYENKKWRGTYRLTQPAGDGSEKDGWAVNAMNNAIAVLQESNPGYTWDWEPVERGDYSQLKGKLMGVLFRNKEWEYDGKSGWTTECCSLIPAADIRDGNFSVPEDKLLAKTSAKPEKKDEAGNGFVDNMMDFDDLPFD